MNNPYFMSVIGSLLFSGSTVVFSLYANRLTSNWVVGFKNFIGFSGFLAVFLWGHWADWPVPSAVAFLKFFASGCLGLLIGDLFLFKAFSQIGSSRTLMVFNLQPIVLTLVGAFAFGQGFNSLHGLGLLLLMTCLFMMSFEKYKTEGTWEVEGVIAAVIGVSLDGAGILLTRSGFEGDPTISSFDGNLYRFVGGLFAFWVMRRWIRFDLFAGWARLQGGEKVHVSLASFSATFASLALWLMALRVGHLGSLAGIAAFSPVGAALWEWLLLKRRPSFYWWISMGLFWAGFLILLRANQN